MEDKYWIVASGVNRINFNDGNNIEHKFDSNGGVEVIKYQYFISE